MKKHWLAWTLWWILLLAVLALGVYVLIISPELTPQPIEEVFPRMEGTFL